MSEQIRMIFVLLVSVMLMVLSIELSILSKTNKYLKEDLEVAVHDAALALDTDALANGQVVFDQDIALKNFKETLQVNAGLVEGDYEILEFQVFDHQTNPELLQGEPVYFQASTVNYNDIIINPTIVAIVRTQTKQYFLTNQNKYVTRVASYTYDEKF